MAEMNSLTLNEKKYDSFPDRKVRESYIKNISFLYSTTASKNPEDSEYKWSQGFPEPTEDKPYVWVRIDYVQYREEINSNPPTTIEGMHITAPMLIGCFDESVSAEAVEAAVAKYLKENPVVDPVVEFEVDVETLNMNEGVLSVNTTNEVLEDDPRPITSGAVYEEFSKAVALLKTI